MISSSSEDLEPMQDQLQQEVDVINEWSKQNQMVLNASKTKVLLVTGKRLEIDGKEIDQANSYKLLGFT